MKYLQTFENHSVDFYSNFSILDFPEMLYLSEPNKVKYKRANLVPGANKISLKYDLDSEQPDKNNPYSGDIPEIVTLEIEVFYNNDVPKILFTMNGGSRCWYSFSSNMGVIEFSQESDVSLDNKTLSAFNKIIRKYS